MQLKNENDSIRAKAVIHVPNNFSLSSGFLAAAITRLPNNKPVPSAPIAMGTLVIELARTLKLFVIDKKKSK